MFEVFNYKIDNEKKVLKISSNNGEDFNEVIYLSYENALWLINKLRSMSFEELTNNRSFDTKEFENILNENELLELKPCFVDRGNCWFNITSYWDKKEYKIGRMMIPFSIIEQYEDKFYFKEFIYPFLDELEKYLPKEYQNKLRKKEL